MNLIETINMFRELEGLYPLLESDELNILAQKHAKFMSRRNWINSYKINFINLIAVGDTVDSIIRQWINQPETREIMFGNYNYIGAGNHKSRSGIIYWAVLLT